MTFVLAAALKQGMTYVKSSECMIEAQVLGEAALDHERGVQVTDWKVEKEANGRATAGRSSGLGIGVGRRRIAKPEKKGDQSFSFL